MDPLLCPISRFAKLLHNWQVHLKLRVLSGVKQGLSESCVGGRENEREKKGERVEWRLSQNGISDCQSVSRLHTLQSR